MTKIKCLERDCRYNDGNENCTLENITIIVKPQPIIKPEARIDRECLEYYPPILCCGSAEINLTKGDEALP